MDDNITPEQISHIPGLEEPEDTLLLPQSIISLFEKFSTWSELMPGSTIVLSRMVSTPLIVERASRPSLEIISHPLVWLGERQTQRLLDDNDEPESQDHMILRVALELLTSNVYTPNVGWVDCLSLMGLDRERDAQRIQAWIDGGDDEVLDTFTLDDVLNSEDEPAWSFDAASEGIDALSQISFGYLAGSAAQAARAVLEAPDTPDLDTDPQDQEWTNDQRAKTVAFIAQVAYSLLGGSSGSLRDYADLILVDVDPVADNSFAWEFVRECESLSQQASAYEDELLADFVPVDVEDIDEAASATSHPEDSIS